MRRYTFLGRAASLLVFLWGVASVILFFHPALVGVPQDQEQYYRGRWAWLLTGIGFLIFAVACSVAAGRRSRRLVWVLENVGPEPMRLSVEVEHWSDSTDYYGVLSALKDEPLWRVSLYNPPRWVEALAGKQVPAKVYIDPRGKKPAVIETEYGLLWAGAASKKGMHATPPHEVSHES